MNKLTIVTVLTGIVTLALVASVWVERREQPKVPVADKPAVKEAAVDEIAVEEAVADKPAVEEAAAEEADIPEDLVYTTAGMSSQGVKFRPVDLDKMSVDEPEDESEVEPVDPELEPADLSEFYNSIPGPDGKIKAAQFEDYFVVFTEGSVYFVSEIPESIRDFFDRISALKGRLSKKRYRRPTTIAFGAIVDAKDYDPEKEQIPMFYPGIRFKLADPTEPPEPVVYAPMRGMTADELMKLFDR